MAASTTAPAATVEAVQQRLDALVPFLAERARATEDNRAVLPEVIEALEESGLYTLSRPKHFGGLEASEAQRCKALATIARGCPSTGWVSSIHIAAIWWLAMFPDAVQDEVFARQNVRAAVAFAPTGKGEPKPGGVVVNGRWGWNTGNASAHWAGLTILVSGDDGTPAPMVALIPYSQVERTDDWDAFGMSGTGSNSVSVADVFVPDERLLPVSALITGQYRSERERANPYFQRPAVPSFVAESAGVPLGIAEGAYEAFLQRLPGRTITYTNYANQAEAPVTHLEIAEATMMLESARHHLMRAAELVDEMDLSTPLESRMRSRAHVGYGTRVARECVALLYQASGASAIMRNVPIQRYHRDIQAIAQHAFLASPTILETYGRTLLGLEPNSVFI